ncbi:uncharacterized protein LOC132737423 [Ruditapes philippinarum]|uniref:uncharacterized protein LOC132737423 n=1 Tax=Ruditapes philippinarum TaxID=129788 RepID=UPI00295A7147|nr:uncharacterized protein LOC132737423 [Ruditapes philippinarum]
MAVKFLLLTMLLICCFNCCFGQWSLRNNLFEQMNRMQENLNRLVANMRTNMQSMQVQIDLDRQSINRRIARQRQFLVRNSNQNAATNGNQNIRINRTYRNGGRSFTTSNGGRGYVYNSPDGSVNIFSYDSGPQYSGSIYRSGPDGTFFRQW